METAADFLRRQAGNASAWDFAKVLDRVADAAPQPGDEQPSESDQRRRARQSSRDSL